MRKAIFLTVLFLMPLTVQAAITTSVDVFSRVTLTTSTAGSSFAWSKSADGNAYVTLGTTTSQSIVDNRPQYHITRVANPNPNVNNPFTFVGDRMAIYGSMSSGGTMTMDGVGYPVQFESDTHTTRPSVDLIMGKALMTNGTHTVNYPVQLSSFIYSDLTVTYGNPVYYKVVIDGSTTETATVTPTVNRKGAAQSFVDRMIAGGAFTWANIPANGYEFIEPVGMLAGAYYMTRDSRLVSLKDDFYTDYSNNIGAYSGWPTGAAFASISVGRFLFNYYSAYKIFGDSRFLTAADTVLTSYMAVSPPNTTSNGYSDVWTGIPNQVMGLVYGCALLYNEPNSAHYHNTALGNTIVHTAEDQYLKGMIQSDGSVPYQWSSHPTRDLVYAFFTMPGIKYISDHWNWRTTEVATMMSWLNSDFPIDEPYFYRSLYFGYVEANYAGLRMMSQYFQNGTVPRNFVDMWYSAAFDTISIEDGTGTDYTYKPEGFAASSAPISGTIAEYVWIFWAAQMFELNNVPRVVWFDDNTELSGVTLLSSANPLSASSSSAGNRTLGTGALTALAGALIHSASSNVLLSTASMTGSIGNMTTAKISSSPFKDTNGNPANATDIYGNPVSFKNIYGNPL